MSLFDLILSGAKVTNLDGTEANIEALDTDGAEVGTTEETEETESTVDETVETTEDSSGDEVIETEELDTELLEVENDVEEVEEAEASSEEIEDAAVATENFLANLYATKAMGGLTAAHGELATEHVNYIAKTIGMPEEHIPAIDYGVESYSTVGGVAMNTEGAIESVKNFFIKILDAIIKGIAWILDKGAQIISKLFNNFNKMEEYHKAVSEMVAKLKDKDKPKGDDDDHKNATALLALNVNGKLVTPDQAAEIVLKVAKEVAAKWDVKLISGTSESIATETEKAVAEYASAIDQSNIEVDKIKNSDKSNLTHTRGFSAASAALGTDPIRKNGLGKWITEIAKGIPYSDGGAVLARSDYGKVGMSINTESETVHVSDILPRNKRVVSVVTDPNRITNKALSKGEIKRVVFRSKCVSWKANSISAGTKMKTMTKSDMEKTLRAIADILQLMSTVKKKIDASSSIISSLNKVINKLRLQYFAITKKQRDGASFMNNIKWTRMNILIVKETIGVLREPGASFCTYTLFEVKSLMDIIKSHAGRYKKSSGKKGNNSSPFGF